MELFDTHITEEAKQYVMEVLESGHLSEGEMVARFEKELENVFGYAFGVAVNSGTSALHLALILAGVGRGDEVILPAQTFVATGLAVLYCGARCVFVDINIDGNINPDDIEHRITRNTKAVISVAWGGNAPDLGRLEEICSNHRLKLIQDNAQALGTVCQGLPISYYGNFSCFSFQAIKQLTTGDGGLLVCNDYEDYKRAKKLRWFGIDREKDLPDGTGERLYNLKQLGYKYHMNDLSAALGIGNLLGILGRQDKRKRIADYYDKHIPGTIMQARRDSSHWLYDLFVENRLEFIKRLGVYGVPASSVHKGIYRNSIFNTTTVLPVQKMWDETHVCIPCHAGLTEDDVARVVYAINSTT